MSNYILEQLRREGIKNHNKMKEQDERRQHYLNRQSQSVPDFRQIYKDMSEQNKERVNSVISYESALNDMDTILSKHNVYKSKEYVNAFEKIFSNTLTAYQLREIAKTVEMILDDATQNKQ